MAKRYPIAANRSFGVFIILKNRNKKLEKNGKGALKLLSPQELFVELLFFFKALVVLFPKIVIYIGRIIHFSFSGKKPVEVKIFKFV